MSRLNADDLSDTTVAGAELRRAAFAIDWWLSRNPAPGPDRVLVAQVVGESVLIAPIGWPADARRVAELPERVREALAGVRGARPGRLRFVIVGEHVARSGETECAIFTSPGGVA